MSFYCSINRIRNLNLYSRLSLNLDLTKEIGDNEGYFTHNNDSQTAIIFAELNLSIVKPEIRACLFLMDVSITFKIQSLLNF